MYALSATTNSAIYLLCLALLFLAFRKQLLSVSLISVFFFSFIFFEIFGLLAWPWIKPSLHLFFPTFGLDRLTDSDHCNALFLAVGGRAIVLISYHLILATARRSATPSDQLVGEWSSDVGIDKMLWASDFPHSASDWPNSHQVLDQMFASVDEEERYQITVGNAVDFFHLDNEA